HRSVDVPEPVEREIGPGVGRAQLHAGTEFAGEGDLDAVAARGAGVLEEAAAALARQLERRQFVIDVDMKLCDVEAVAISARLDAAFVVGGYLRIERLVEAAAGGVGELRGGRSLERGGYVGVKSRGFARLVADS